MKKLLVTASLLAAIATGAKAQTAYSKCMCTESATKTAKTVQIADKWIYDLTETEEVFTTGKNLVIVINYEQETVQINNRLANIESLIPYQGGKSVKFDDKILEITYNETGQFESIRLSK